MSKKTNDFYQEYFNSFSVVISDVIKLTDGIINTVPEPDAFNMSKLKCMIGALELTRFVSTLRIK